MPLKHLTYWRKKAGLNQQDAANSLKLSQGHLSKLERGESDTTVDVLMRMARLYSVSLSRLVAEDRGEVRLVGAVGAGDTIWPYDKDATFETIESPPGFSDGEAVVVRGDSMEPAYRDGDVLLYNRRVSVGEDAIGHDCVLQLAAAAGQVHGNMLLKTVRPGSRTTRFHLLSYNPRHALIADALVEWASPIRWIKRS